MEFQNCDYFILLCNRFSCIVGVILTAHLINFILQLNNLAVRRTCGLTEHHLRDKLETNNTFPSVHVYNLEESMKTLINRTISIFLIEIMYISHIFLRTKPANRNVKSCCSDSIYDLEQPL